MPTNTISIYPLLYKLNEHILNPLIALAFTVAFVFFFIGIISFIRNTGDAEGLEKGKKNIIYGLIGMVIMASVFGILYTILATFGISDQPLRGIQ